MNDELLVKSVLPILQKSFDWDEDAEMMEELRRKLTLKIKELMDQNWEKLLNILYRIDVSENKVKQVLAYVDPKNIPQEIADLIIQRQIEKVKFRMNYQNPPKGKNAIE